MSKLKFKTTINCENCLARVTPVLDKKEGIKSWNVDIENADKILTVETDSLTAGDIIRTVKRTGFEAEEI